MGARSLLRRGSTWLVGYVIILAVIGFWPQHVDKPYGRIIQKIEFVPLLTYQRLEFGANVLLFVPFGFLLSMTLRRKQHLVVPLAFLVSLLIESVQAIALAGRTPSVTDLVANTAGACIGLVALAGVDRLRADSRPDASRAGRGGVETDEYVGEFGRIDHGRPL
jgi:hypothetical protein